MELTGLNRIAFSVADDPFYKPQRARFYPEVILMNLKGQVKARINPDTRRHDVRGLESLIFEEDFREPQLKINDDRRVQINLSSLVPKSKTIQSDNKKASGSSLKDENH
jgi:hypothetical protein